MVLKTVVFLCALTSALLQLDHEGTILDPIQSIKLQIPTLAHSSFWNVLREVDAKQAGVMTSLLKKGLHKYRAENPQTSILVSKGERVISKDLSPDVKLDTLFELPYSNYLSLLSVSLAILMENQKPSTIHGPMGKALAGKDLQNPIFNAHKKKTLYDVLSDLPTPYDAESIMNLDTLDNLNNSGEVLLFYVNSILGDTMSEAWMDALFALGIETFSVTAAGQLKISLYHVLHYALSVIHELQSENAFSVDVLPNVDQPFLLGWWINCPRKLNVCLFPGLPEDLVLSASPSLRIYISPSLEFSMIVFNNNTTGIKSLRDIANTDEAIWTEIRGSLENAGGSSDRFSMPASAESDKPATAKSDLPASAESDKPTVESDGLVIVLIKLFYPFIFFMFWLMAVHGLVYWTLHFCWFVTMHIAMRTHVPRPKTAAKVN